MIKAKAILLGAVLLLSGLSAKPDKKIVGQVGFVPIK
jgi:hypothetical protein